MNHQSTQQTDKNREMKCIVIECPGFEQKMVVSNTVWNTIPQDEKEIFLRASGTNQTKTWDTGAFFSYKKALFTIQYRDIAGLGGVLVISEGQEALNQ